MPFLFSITDMTTEEGNAVSRGLQYVWSRTKLMLHSWKLYLTSEVREAGIALSLLYMTVLGFDNITYAYCLDQCVSESLLGGMVALSAIFGITGSYAYSGFFLDIFPQQVPTESWRFLEFFENFLEFFAKFLEFF